MPYILDGCRDALYPSSQQTAQVPGDLNYQITELLDLWLLTKPLSYERINAAIGVLECAKLELYRRIAAPYEDRKMAENGDVFTPELVTK